MADIGLNVYGRYRKKFMNWHDKRKKLLIPFKIDSRWLFFQAEIDAQEESLNNYENCPFEVKCPLETNSTNGVYELRLFVASKCSVYNNRSLPCIVVQIVYFTYKNLYSNICLPECQYTYRSKIASPEALWLQADCWKLAERNRQSATTGVNYIKATISRGL